MSQVKSNPVHASMIFKKIPRALRSAFKAACALRGVTMRDQFEKMMRDFVKEGNHK